MDAKAVVIGAAGGIGAAVARILLAQGYAEVHTISREAAFPDACATHWQTRTLPRLCARNWLKLGAPILKPTTIPPRPNGTMVLAPLAALRQIAPTTTETALSASAMSSSSSPLSAIPATETSLNTEVS